ncbi:MAG: TRAP transporter substrate-binding protein DctP [Acidobacteriota bacterium]
MTHASPRRLASTSFRGFLLVVSVAALSIAALSIAALSIATVCAPAASATTLKVATLAPEGSVWDQAYRDMGQAWADGTDGAVTLRLYGGGVAGDEPATVRKMRIGQLHGAVLTVAGLQVIDPVFAVFEIPMFFDSYAELEHVLDAMRPDFEQRLDAAGYAMLGWSQAGWVHLFSTEPVRTVDELKTLKLYSWAGDTSTATMWRQNGFQPVSVASTDILTGLQTGMLEAVPTTPLAAASLQWFRQTPYMQDLGFAPLVGAIMVSKRAFSRLDPVHQKVLRQAGQTTEDRLFEDVPARDSEAVAEMSKRGLEVVEVPAEHEQAWRDAAEIFADHRRQGLDDKAFLDRVRAVRDAYRAAHDTP